MKRQFYRWLFWKLCDLRKTLNAAITYCRDRAFLKPSLTQGPTP